MSNDRYQLWRIIGNNYAGMKGHAPDGYEPVVFKARRLVGPAQAFSQAFLGRWA
jgi:hypothetical protein